MYIGYRGVSVQTEGSCGRGIWDWPLVLLADAVPSQAAVLILTSFPSPLSSFPPLLPSVFPDHSSLLLHVKSFVSDIRSLSCQLAILQGNGEGCPDMLFCPPPLLAAPQLLHPPSVLPPGSEKTCCPVNWLEYEGSCYWFSRTGKPWPEAEKYCQLENGHLAVVGSREEQVRALEGSSGRLAGLQRGHTLLSPQKFIQHHMGPGNMWIGLTDQNGPWRWVDGTDYETGFK